MAIHTDIYLKDSYTTEGSRYQVNRYIREYDISQANINILLSIGMIDRNTYDRFLSMDRNNRLIQIGCMLRDNPDMSKALSLGFKEYRKKFFDANDILPFEVISVKKDAIYLIDKIPKFTQFDYVTFANKNLYTSFYLLPGIELYYYADIVNKIENIDVKGISDSKVALHKGHFLEFLCAIFYELQVGSLNEALAIVRGFYDKYNRRELDLGYYRSFDARSSYIISTGLYNSYQAMHIGEEARDLIDISVNRRHLEVLHSYIVELIFAKNRR